MRNLFFAAACILAAPASADMITKTSGFGVEKVFATVDHAKGAETVGMDLRPTIMVLFGNPKLGTPALQASQTAGLDLPLRVVVYEDEQGTTRISYHAPDDLGMTHGIPADAEVLQKMTGALGKLTDVAAGR